MQYCRSRVCYSADYTAITFLSKKQTVSQKGMQAIRARYANRKLNNLLFNGY